MIMRMLLTSLSVLMLSSCGLLMSGLDYEKTGGHNTFLTPRAPFLEAAYYDESPFGQGVRDGCNQMTGVTGSGLQRLHGFAYDVNRGIADDEYYEGYQFGAMNCHYYLDRDPI